jgi:hypothetical protein
LRLFYSDLALFVITRCRTSGASQGVLRVLKIADGRELKMMSWKQFVLGILAAFFFGK